MKKIINFEDIGYTVVADGQDYKVDYKIYQIDGRDKDDNLLWDMSTDRGYTHTDKLEDADVFLEGYVKWDGCSNWMFSECKNNTMIHFCEPEQMLNVGAILYRCYKLTEELCGSWDGD